MSKIFSLLCLMIVSWSLQAQQGSGKITGQVLDQQQKTVAAATVTLLKAKDSAVVKMNAAAKDGSFVFENIANGSYLVAVSSVGYSKAFSPIFEINESKLDVALKTISLALATKDLTAVTVTGRKQLIEQHIDKTVVNVEAAASNVGATALEVLEKSPGITVDKDGGISLKGKQGVQVFIDGKPSYLSGAELVNLLKNMSASQLEQIEIMTNPPAKYDAAGNSGIINLRTKKNKAKGFNGSATAGYSQGVYWRTNESLNLNYRNAGYNAFLNYNYSKNNSYQQLDIHRVYLQPDGTTVKAMFDQTAFMPRSNTNNSLKLGMDFFVNKKTTIGFVASGFINPEDQRNYNTSYLKDPNAVVDSIVQSSSTDRNKWKNGALNLNYRKQFDSTGRELTADLDYSTYAAASHQYFINGTYTPQWQKKGQTDLKSVLPVDINIYSAKMDYTHPLKKGARLETGIKSSYVNTDNAANYFNVVGGNDFIDYDKTNRFQYKENVNAAYVNYNRQFKKWGIQAGLRFENTNYKGHQFGNAQRPGSDSSFSRTYNNLFPTAFLSYNLNKNNQFGLSVGRRIDRPAYQDLNPFLFFLDNYTYGSGNPFLKPQYTNNIELSHTFKGFLNTTVNYSDTKNFFTETFEQKDYATIVRQGNIGQRQNAGISMSAQVKLTKWWSSNLYGNYNYNYFKGQLYGEQITISASNVLFNVNNQFSFGKGWSAELSGFYRTRGIEGQIAIMPLGQASAGISKQILKGKGTVRANIRDIFYTSGARGEINFQQTQARFENTRDSRVAGISFSYRFGKPLKGPQNNRKKGGADDELNRVKAGGNN
ncbi:MAG TPA: TonB-dependent receptor [Chitinophagaceae bacterium]|nr:TonB-dependent receptor [Chitinophagaceae bacterium]